MVRTHEWDVSRRLARPPGGRGPWWGAHSVPIRPALRLEWESAGAHSAVWVSGDLDAVTAPQLEAVMAERRLAGCSVLEVDLRGVPSIGSTGLSVLLDVRRWCLQRRIDLRIRGAQPSVWRVFELTGLDGVFTAAGGPTVAPPAQDPVLF